MVIQTKKAVKLYGIFFLVFIGVVMTVSGCQTSGDVNKKLKKDSVQESKREAYTVQTDTNINLSDYVELSAEELLEPSDTLLYPDGVDFVPTLFSDDGFLYGEARSMEEEGSVFLGALNVHTKQFSKIMKTKSTSAYVTIAVTAATEKYVVFEEFDQEAKISHYYLYKSETGEIVPFFKIENIPAIHYTQAALNDNRMLINIYDPADQGYKNYFFDFSTMTMELIEASNCGFPVFFRDAWYYLQIDNEGHQTTLIQLNDKSGVKAVLYQSSSSESFISSVFASDTRMFFSLQKQESAELYEVDSAEKKIKHRLKAEGLDDIEIGQNFLTWVGPPRTANKVRPQYYLIDLETQKNYLYDESIVLLSKAGIVWVQFKLLEDDIPKGTIFRNEHSVIRYKSN